MRKDMIFLYILEDNYNIGNYTHVYLCKSIKPINYPIYVYDLQEENVFKVTYWRLSGKQLRIKQTISWR